MTSAKRILDQAHCGFVGINANLEVSTGFDDREVSANLDHVSQADWDHPDMLPAERVKLADEMIARWTHYREGALK